jgi:two-component system NtrC family response regulator
MTEDSIRVLIIDDEPNIRTGLAKGLSRVASHVDTAEDAVEGLAAFERGGPEIVITDLRLPGEIDGLEVLRQ